MEQLRRVVQPLQVLGQPEDGRPLRGLVAANALEHTRAVVEPVRADVDPGVRPVDELAVHPDLLGLAHAPPRSTGLLAGKRIDAGVVTRPRPRARPARGGRAPRAGGRRDGCGSRLRSTRLVEHQRAVDQHAGDAGSGNGATAPGSNPVTRATYSASAILRAYGSRRRRAILRGLARWSPGTSARIALPSQSKTSDFTICARLQPAARAASSAVGVVLRRTPRFAPRPRRARRKAATRSTGSGHVVIAPASSSFAEREGDGVLKRECEAGVPVVVEGAG